MTTRAAIIPLIALTVAALLLLIWLIRRHGKQRTAQFNLVATQMGLSFSPKGEKALMERLSPLPLFTRGHSKKMSNLLRGTSGQLGISSQVEAGIFDYRYNTGGGQHQQSHAQSVICFHAPQLSLPAFSLRPKNFFHKIGTAFFGYQDIDFDSHPRFSKRYLLRGQDVQSIRTLFTQEALAFFETQDNLSVEGKDDQLIVYRRRALWFTKRVTPTDVRLFIEDGSQVFRLFEL